jgi:uncharacterized protein (TIGR02996 family)
MSERDLLQWVVKDPESDEPRLKYAQECDWRNDPRGEFIRLQLMLARSDARDHEDFYRLSVRERELVEEHGEDWAEPVADLVHRFHRGFVEFIRVTGRKLLEQAEAFFSAQPILHLELTEAGADVVRKLVDLPLLSQIRSLSLDRSRLDDEEVRALADSPHLQNLLWLSLAHNRVTERGLDTLARATRSGPLSGLCYVNLYGNPADPAQRYAEESGTITETWAAPEAVALEQRYGRIPWLHRDGKVVAHRFPDRFEVADRYAEEQGRGRLGMAETAVKDEPVAAYSSYR